MWVCYKKGIEIKLTFGETSKILGIGHMSLLKQSKWKVPYTEIITKRICKNDFNVNQIYLLSQSFLYIDEAEKYGIISFHLCLFPHNYQCT